MGPDCVLGLEGAPPQPYDLSQPCNALGQMSPMQAVRGAADSSQPKTPVHTHLVPTLLKGFSQL